MQTLSDEQIMVALCCGGECKRNGGTYCHRWDFENEAKRIRALLQTVVAEHEREHVENR